MALLKMLREIAAELNTLHSRVWASSSVQSGDADGGTGQTLN